MNLALIAEKALAPVGRLRWYKRRFVLLEDKLYCYEKTQEVLVFSEIGSSVTRPVLRLWLFRTLKAIRFSTSMGVLECWDSRLQKSETLGSRPYWQLRQSIYWSTSNTLSDITTSVNDLNIQACKYSSLIIYRCKYTLRLLIRFETIL